VISYIVYLSPDRVLLTFLWCNSNFIIHFRWIHSDWTQCSKSCEGGYRTRNVSCVQVYQDEVEPIQTTTECDDETKPSSLDRCNNHPCHNHWHSGNWSRVRNIKNTTYLKSHIFYHSALLIVGMEFKAEMSHVGMAMETRYTNTVVVCSQSLMKWDCALDTCVSTNG